MIELGMAVGASVAWGASDFVAGIAARRRSIALVLVGSQVTGLALMAVSVLVAGGAMPSSGAIALAAGAGLCEVLGFAALYVALSSGPMGPVAPIAALGGLVPLSVHVAGGGALSPAAGVGVAVGLLGVALVSVEGRGAKGGGERGGVAASRGVSRRSMLFAAASALAFGVFFVLLQRASVAADPLAAVGVSRAFAVAATLPLLLFMFRPRAPHAADLRDLLVIAAVGVLDIGANTLYAIGASHSTDAGLAVIASTYPVATILLAQVILGERMGRLQTTGVALTLTAVLLIGGV